ncbi:MAG: 50S ribosomal protein L10 [Alicyclobacillaceae bacterium]|nr:50S ribosomal protein L10 [Alicyclobacillaceae bacterium]
MGVQREAKAQVVQEVAERLTGSAAAVVTDYRGLNVAEVTELRKRLREAGVEYRVVKNTLCRLAVDRIKEQVDLEPLKAYLTGPTAIAFSKDDPVAPAKILNDFARTYKALELKGGVVEGRVVSAQDVVNLASLPSREGLLAMLLSVLQAPIRNFAYAVKQVAEQKGGAGE